MQVHATGGDDDYDNDSDDGVDDDDDDNDVLVWGSRAAENVSRLAWNEARPRGKTLPV